MNNKQHPKKAYSLRQTFAAIDLGTNSCRLLVGRYDGVLKIVDSYSKVVRLGENLGQTNLLCEEAIERSLKTLKICVEKVKNNDVTHIRAVATEACRRAMNTSILLDRAKNDLDLTIEVISNEEEALLALTGCSGAFQGNIPYGIVFDIGGGSTEIMWVAIKEGIPNFDVMDWISLPFGVVTLSDAYGAYSTSPRIYDQIRKKIKEKLIPFSEKNKIQNYIHARQVQMVGTSGTGTTLAAIHLKLQRYDRYLIDGIYLRGSEIRSITQSILHMTPKQRNSHPCIGVGRSDLAITGAAILEGICDTWTLPWIRVADRGVREGILMSLIHKYHALS